MDASARGRAVSPGLGKAGPRGGFRAERGSDGRYRWQLKASNGRLVAVSPAAFETQAEAERSFESLRTAAPELVARITHVRDGIGWIWVVPGARGLPEIRSSRPYERYATCQNAFRRFVVLLAKLAEPTVSTAAVSTAAVEQTEAVEPTDVAEAAEQHPVETRRLRPSDAR